MSLGFEEEGGKAGAPVRPLGGGKKRFGALLKGLSRSKRRIFMFLSILIFFCRICDLKNVKKIVSPCFLLALRPWNCFSVFNVVFYTFPKKSPLSSDWCKDARHLDFPGKGDMTGRREKGGEKVAAFLLLFTCGEADRS